MDVVERNFLRLLRSGTFGDDSPIEPMSQWKWERLYQTALMHGVAALVYDGIRSREGEFFINLSNEQRETWRRLVSETEEKSRQTNILTARLFEELNHRSTRPILLKGQAIATLYNMPLHRTSGDCDIFFPLAPQSKKADDWAKCNCDKEATSEKGVLQYMWKGIKVEHHHRMVRLTNVFLNRTLQSIVNKEIRCCDSTYLYIDGQKIETLPPTLNLLYTMVRIAKYILNDGVSLKQIIELGMILRKIGDKVDFIKLQQWIDKLHMGDMAQLEGALLTGLMNFSQDEIPFMRPNQKDDISAVTRDIFNLKGNHTYDWYFTQGKNVFVSTNNKSAMMWHINHSRRFFRYYPSETVTNFFTSFAHSLSHIEE